MSKKQINKYVWLVDTIYKAKKITLKEINRRWLDTDLSEGLEIPRRTFGNWKNAAEEIFGLVIKRDDDQANYLRSLPLHHSQKETERTDGYSIFTMRLRPTFDFRQELLWNGDALEVLEPLWIRNEIADTAKRMWHTYKTT